MAGGEPEIVHIQQLRDGERHLQDYQMLVLPGGFAYGDALGAGRLTALDLSVYLADALREFILRDQLVIGICNGFQALVKAGVLPGDADGLPTSEQTATLARNRSGQFECRWVTLHATPSSPCLFTQGLDEPITCPVAHGEGRFMVNNTHTLEQLRANGQIALTYAASGPEDYPANPNGSIANIAGVCNTKGNVLGLMPHPENHIHAWQHPGWSRGERGGLGLRLFQNGLRALRG